MPIISPFRALSYAPHLRGELEHLIAPPYDVISEDRRTSIAARHPNNIVHLDLPEGNSGADRYQVAAGLLNGWIDDRVMVRDSTPAFYVCRQRFRTPLGDERSRCGFFARVRLEPFGNGAVMPHERTLDRPRLDRQRLLEATRTHLSAVFLLHPDPDGRVADMMRAAAESPGGHEVRDADGTISRLTQVEEAATIATLEAQLRDEWALIADGHHRYEASLAYREERRRAGNKDADHLLAFFCSLKDPGLAIFPIHRLVHSLEDFDAGRFRRSLDRFFSMRRIDSQEELIRAVDEGSGRAGVYGLLVKGELGGWLLEWKEGVGQDEPVMASVPPPLRRLDVILLHRLVFETILGITPDAQARQTNLDYAKDVRELFRRMDEGPARIGFLVNPTRMEQVLEVTRQGLRLPQKSTYFHPKVPTGLVLDSLDE